MNRLIGTNGCARLEKKGIEALQALEAAPDAKVLQKAHSDSNDLRNFAERFRQLSEKRSEKESYAHFELAQTGNVQLKLLDAKLGSFELELSFAEVEAALKALEESDDNERPLSSFFLPE